MKNNTKSFARWILVAIVGCTLASDSVEQQRAFGQSYRQPNFTQMGMGPGQLGPRQQGSQQFPAAFLAGGPAAAQGSDFVDVSGKTIQLTNYCPGGCPPGGGGYGGGYGGDCQTCPGGMGMDPMAVDFGGQGQDQCGPHYFDLAFEAVFFKLSDSPGEGLPAFSSFGNGFAPGQTNNPFLNPAGAGDDLQAGWRVVGRYDIGALSVFEATYTGMYDAGFEQTVNSADINPAQPNQLFSIFSNYGFIDQDGGDGIDGIPGLDEASQHTLSYTSDLQTVEFSYRRYWVGNRPRISGTYLLGFRYTRLTEDLLFSAITQNGNGSIGAGTENDLVGFQFGGDTCVCLRQGLRGTLEFKSGIYNNRFKFGNSISNVGANTFNVQPAEEGNQLAFIAEGGIGLVADILPSWSVRTGYEWLYMNSLVTVNGNINTTMFDDLAAAPAALGTQGHALYHGFHAGVEYVW